MTLEEFKNEYSHQRYLGDGVYASFDGYHIVLMTHDGIQMTNEISLEPKVMGSLYKYQNTMLEDLKRIGETVQVEIEE